MDMDKELIDAGIRDDSFKTNLFRINTSQL